MKSRRVSCRAAAAMTMSVPRTFFSSDSSGLETTSWTPTADARWKHRSASRHELLDEPRIVRRPLDELDVARLAVGEVAALTGGEVVEHDDARVACSQDVDQMGSDESRAARDEDTRGGSDPRRRAGPFVCHDAQG